MQTGSSRGMLTMEQSLADLVLRRVITADVAFSRSTRPGPAARPPGTRRLRRLPSLNSSNNGLVLASEV